MSISLINLLILISPILFVTGIIYFLSDNMNHKKLKNTLAEIIYIANFIQNIETSLDYILYDNNSDIFTDKITPNSKLRYNQYVFLYYIEKLQIIQYRWDYFNNNNFFNNSNIKCPYIVAYKIRELLNIPTEEDIWLNKDEKECLKNNKELSFINSDSECSTDSE